MVVRSIAFARRKYGPELLVDVGWVRDLFAPGREPHRLDFYDILLVTKGRGTFRLDDRVHRVKPGRVLFTTPGQVRLWDVGALDGICLFFAGAFVEEFFADPFFLHRLPYFHRPEGDLALDLPPRDAAALRRRLERMARELRRLEGDSPDLLRAMLHEELLTLQRLYVREKGASAAPSVPPLVERFLGLVERRFREDGDVATYARALGVTAGHLHTTTRRSLGTGAKAVITGRRVVEAKRLLWYTDRAAAEIAPGLGFADPSYFCRFFRRMTGLSPIAFRRRAPGRAARGA